MVWQPPPRDYIGINLDVSFVESIDATSVGLLIGFSLMMSSSSWDFIGRNSSVNIAEIRACLAGLYVGLVVLLLLSSLQVKNLTSPLLLI